MEAAGLVEKVETFRPLRFNFEDIRKLPPPIIAFNDVAFSYSGKKEDYLYKNLSFGIEYVPPITVLTCWLMTRVVWTRELLSLAPTELASQLYYTSSWVYMSLARVQSPNIPVSSSPSTHSIRRISYRMTRPPSNTSRVSMPSRIPTKMLWLVTFYFQHRDITSNTLWYNSSGDNKLVVSVYLVPTRPRQSNNCPTV
jgi:hypothetical protein